MSDLLSFYHRLPYPLKVFSASLRGFQLRNWRYGTETEKLVKEALDRESWSKNQWQTWQEDRLAFILQKAATEVPYYRNLWQERRRNGNHSSWELLSNWPVLNKETVRLQARSFLADGCDIHKMYTDHTSGTTGTPIHLWLSRKTCKQQYAIFEARIRSLFGVSYRNPWGIFGGQVVIPATQKKPPFWVKNFGLNQMYFSVLHIAPWTAQAYIEEIQRSRITHLIVYTISLYALACEVPVEMRPIKSNLKAIFTNAEPLFDFQREVLEQVFDCPVIETYGLAEMVCAASQCDHGKMHWWPEYGIPEVINDEGEPAQSGETGRLIATGLLNSDMPLIRYDTKDLSTLPSPDDTCKCGRSLPLAGKFFGRYDDVILTRDGRKLTQLDTIFDPSLPLKEAQIVQNTLDDFVIRVVVDIGWAQKDADFLINELQKRVGNVNVRVVQEKQIERTWAGKFRIIVSNINN